MAHLDRLAVDQHLLRLLQKRDADDTAWFTMAIS
jgi:hypothetical protein